MCNEFSKPYAIKKSEEKNHIEQLFINFLYKYINVCMYGVSVNSKKKKEENILDQKRAYEAKQNKTKQDKTKQSKN